MTRRTLIDMTGGGFRLAVSRAGYDVITSLGNNQALAFDSDWLEAAKILVAGTGYAAATAEDAGYYRLATFPDAGFTPVCWVYHLGRPFGLAYVDGGEDDGTYASQPGVAPPSPLPIRVTPTTLSVRSGNPYNGYSRPTHLFTYLVFNNPVVT